MVVLDSRRRAAMTALILVTGIFENGFGSTTTLDGLEAGAVGFAVGAPVGAVDFAGEL